MRLYSIATICHKRALLSRNFSSSSKFLSQTFRQIGMRKYARLQRKIHLLKIDPLSVVRFLVERIFSFLKQPSLCACRRGVAAASMIQLPRKGRSRREHMSRPLHRFNHLESLGGFQQLRGPHFDHF